MRATRLEMDFTLLALLVTGCTDGDSDGLKSVDNDGDGYVGNVDCNDDDASVHPDAIEVCDPYEVDEDCNGFANNNDAAATGTLPYYRDGDGDGFGGTEDVQNTCSAPEGYTATAGDCDDIDPDINPNATEICDDDDVDENCDGKAEDQDPEVDVSTKTIFYADVDGDGFGEESLSTEACDLPPGYIEAGGDCDDTRADINPLALEVCDADDADEDCDGVSDDADPSAQYPNVFFTDADDDTYGSLSSPVYYCDRQPYTADNAEDCDDTNERVNPGAAEVCDAYNTDEECDGDADDEDGDATGTTTLHVDADNDGYGSATYTVDLCDNPGGYVDNAEDCDDTRRDVNPDADEVCDDADVDEDCDGAVDDADPTVDRTTRSAWFVDADGDGYGGEISTTACDAPSGSVTDSTDCDDGEALMNPGETEVCNDSLDNDCDGTSNGCGLSGDLPVTSASAEVYGESGSDGVGDAIGLGAMGDLNDDGYDDLVVGAYTASGSATNSGEVYVFYGPVTGSHKANTADWTIQGKVINDWFGYATVSDGDLDGDGRDDLAVGAPYGTTSDYGSVSVYTSAGASSATTTIEGDTIYGGLGSALSIADLTGDGEDDLVAAAPSDGAIYVFEGPLTAGTKVSSTATSSYAEAGAGQVMSSGDFDGDGIDDLAAGDPSVDGSPTYGGAVLVWEGGVTGSFDRADAVLRLTGEASGDQLGFGVALNGDWDDDGYADLAVGAPDHDDGSVMYTGMLYVVMGPRTGIASVAVTADESLYVGNPADFFGNAVSYIGDINGDGTDELAVGSYGGEITTSDGGVVWLLSGAGTGTAEAWIYGVDSGEYCGWNLAPAGDNNGDGTPDFVVGCPLATVSAAYDGAVRMFLGGGI